MYIYKISNIYNDKIYIGQTIRPIEQRFHRHINDAINNVLDTHFARAIRYYGPAAFQIELIDTATTQNELNQKEQQWINHYNSVENGYNETNAIDKCGGNTYQSKTEEEMKVIRKKLSQSKMGGRNPAATGVKCYNINTHEEYHFASQADMQRFFKAPNHQFVSRRCLHKINKPYKNEWLIAYENSEYIQP